MLKHFPSFGATGCGGAEPGFARAQPRRWLEPEGVKEGAHGGTLGSPVLNAMGLGGHNACVLIGRIQ
jgi:hypothetical protein